jgi:hypothetical protein
MRWPFFVSLFLLASLVLMLFVETRRANENAEAQEILNSAIASYSRGQSSSYGEKYGWMEETRTLLDRIVTEYPSSDLAVQIMLSETIGPIDIPEVDRVLAGVTETPPP